MIFHENRLLADVIGALRVLILTDWKSEVLLRNEFHFLDVGKTKFISYIYIFIINI